MAVFRVEKTKDFTVMSNHHLRNKSLSLKAKGLLTLMLSLPEEWDYTTRGLAAICKENRETISKVVNELVNARYITREQERGAGGKMGKSIYTIYENPHENQCSNDIEPWTEKPTTVKPTTVKPSTEKPLPVNSPQLNTNISNIKKSNTECSNYLSNQSLKPAKPAIDMDMIERYREIIHENIEYDVSILNEPKDKEYIDEIVEVMLECVTAEGVVKIGGQEYSSEVVKSRMLKIDSSHIDYILFALSKNTAKVRNIRAYLRTTIFNAPTTLNSFYRAEVNHDFS